MSSSSSSSSRRRKQKEKQDVDLSAYSAYFREYALLIEYKQMVNYAPRGVYVCPGKDASVWHGMICLRQGMYKGGCFKFEIQIPEGYPDARPGFRFTSPVFHPRVEEGSGSVDLALPFPTWRAHNEHMWHLLAYVKKLFYTEIAPPPPPAEAANPEAAALLDSDREAFALQARQSVQSSLSLIYVDKKDSVLSFDEWTDVHQAAMQAVLDAGQSPASSSSSAPSPETDHLFQRINDLVSL